tara:strand:+ start:1219 stop:1956 length:738 start_codon:yes stop_codon:yes gene_type:complete
MPRKQKQYHFIYKTTNILSGKYYYGMHSTDDLNDGYLGSGRRIQYSINKHGVENHKREIIEFCKNRKELALREKEIINLNEIAKEDCINLMVGGLGRPIGFKVSDETRKKNSEIMKNRPINWYAIQKMKETRAGSSHTKESRRRISKSNIGKTHTDDTKEYLSQVMIERWQDDDMRKKYSESAKKRPSNRKGVELSNDTKKRISESKKGKPIKKQIRVICPHCGKNGAEGGMKRYHFDNCKIIKK